MAKERIIEIDLLRTVAIVMMVIYHTAYDLLFFHGWEIDLFGGSWQAFRIVTAGLFLLISGAAVHFSKRPLRRALIVIGCALFISIATYVYDPSTFIYFGILHCIGLGMLILIPLKHLKELNIPLGIAVMMLPEPSAPLPTLDYYPPIPWIGLMLIGAGVGHYLYIRNNLRLLTTVNCQLITIPGRHALLIYLVHQPVLLALLQIIL